jgi:flagellar hook assembly protein FlgD
MLFPGRMRALGLAAFLLVLATFSWRTPAAASITGFHITPANFSPNGDGVRDLVTVAWFLTDSASDVHIAIQVSGVNDAPVLRHFDLGPRPAGPDSLTWDGRDSSAVLLPDERYAITVSESLATGGAALPLFGVVVLDDTPPRLPVIDGAVDSSQVELLRDLSGTANGADSVRVFVDGAFDTTIVTQSSSVDTVFSFLVTLHPGANLLAVQAKDLAGNISPLTSPVTARYVNAPDLGAVRASPAFFSPNGDAVADTTHLTFDLDAPSSEVIVDIRAGEIPIGGIDNSTPVAHLLDGPLAAGTTIVAWDGRDSAGTRVPDGLYEFRLTALTFTADGTPFFAPTLNLQLHLDTTPPGTPVLDPPPPSVSFRATQRLVGSSAGAESVFVDRNGTRIAEGGQTFSLEVPLLPDVNVFTLTARDTAGNASLIGATYTVNAETPVGFHANERFRPGDAFVLNLTKPATAIDLSIYTLKGRLVRRLSSLAVNNHYDLEWDGKDDLGLFAGDGPYVARVLITYFDGTRSEAKGAVVLVK